ncbi:MAG: hypothetical protein ACPGXZ_00700 [Saprospiraceae bacterium]
MKPLLNDIIVEALETTNFKASAKALKKKYKLRHSIDHIRVSLSVVKDIANRDDIIPSDLLQLKAESYDKNGELTSSKYGTRPNNVPDKKGFKIVGFTERPSGGAWTRYAADDMTFYDENFLDSLSERINNLTPLAVPKVKHNNKTLLFIISDRHIGASVQKNALYKKKNDYSADVYKNRLQAAAQRLKWYKENFGSFEKLILLDLGDLMDGFNANTTRGGHKLIQNLDNIGQFNTYVDNELPLWDWIVENKIADSYEFRATSNSNHDGLGISYYGFDSVRRLLNLKYPQIECNITSEFINHFHIYDQPIAYTHGKDEEFMKRGLPLYINAEVENKLKQYCDINDIHKHLTLYKGDLHQTAKSPGKFIDYINLGSLFGSSGYIMLNYGYTPPSVYFGMYEHKSSSILHDWHTITC